MKASCASMMEERISGHIQAHGCTHHYLQEVLLMYLDEGFQGVACLH